MKDFDFYLAFLGLLLGLAMAELLSRLADVIGSRHKIKVGLMSPLLATALMLGILSTWSSTWAGRDSIAVNRALIYFVGINTSAFFLAASLVFPRKVDEWPSLDEYYWKHKRWVAGISLLTSALAVCFATVFQATDPNSMQHWSASDWIWEAVFITPLAVLLFSRSRRIDLVALGVFIFQYLAAAVIEPV